MRDELDGFWKIFIHHCCDGYIAVGLPKLGSDARGEKRKTPEGALDALRAVVARKQTKPPKRPERVMVSEREFDAHPDKYMAMGTFDREVIVRDDDGAITMVIGGPYDL